ncbi:MAG: DUF2384 domain-containing protein [Schleiferiaceae bacterium]|nr:DUF2384 domain-containing protein [Schleiferiaceae bacterium]
MLLKVVIMSLYHALLDQAQALIPERYPGPPAQVAEAVEAYGRPDLPGLLSDKILLSRLIQQGLPVAIFRAVEARLPYSEAEWAALLNISLKTLQRYKAASDFRFKPLLAEKILELAALMVLGETTFNDSATFQRWLTAPNTALGGRAPSEFVQDSFGQELVRAELIRIEHGLFS